jgi:head-tail adaptor
VIKAGELDDRIRLFSPAAMIDDGFQRIPNGWVDEGEIWARHISGSPRETFEVMGREGELPVVFKVRSWDMTNRINDTWKLNHLGITYDVKGAIRDGRDAIRITAVGTDEQVIS